MRAMPFRTASDYSVKFAPPRLRVGDALIESGKPAPTWDYLTTSTVVGGVQVDATELLRSTALDDLSGISATMQVDCASTGFRETVALPVVQAADHEAALQLVIGPHTVADQIEISYGLVLDRELEPRPSMAPYRRGSRVFASTQSHRFILEGDAAGFPTEAFAFGPAGLPKGAPWHLRFNLDSLEDPFMGAVRLFINTEHQASEQLLSGSPGLHRSVLFHSVLEQLLVTAADHNQAADADDWSELLSANHTEGSVGAVLSSLTTTYLEMALPAAMAAVRTDRARVLTKLRESAGLLLGDAR